MLSITGLFLVISPAMAGPLVAHGVNTSRVIPGNQVTTTEVAGMMSKVRTIAVGNISGPNAGAFKNGALSSINDTRQGRYQTAAEMGASVVGGLGKLASVSTKTAVSNVGFVGAGLVGGMGAKVIDDASEAAAERLDGIDRHPVEGFGIIDESSLPSEDGEKKPASPLPSAAKLQTAANVAGMVGAGQVKSALEMGKNIKSIGDAFFREGVAGNSPKFSGVKLPIKGVDSSSGDGIITATVKREQKPDKHFKETRTKKKRDKNGKIVRDKDGKPIIIKYEVDCIKRVVEVTVNSSLSLRGGSKIMTSKKSGTGSDKQCGKDRMKKIKSPDALSRPIVQAAGKKWGAHVQPQMETIRLKFFPTGSTALAVSHMMQNSHAPGMCLLDDALGRNSGDLEAMYNKATILEAYGLYDDALVLYQQASASENLKKGRWSKGESRITTRLNHLQLMQKAYGMTAQDTTFPYAENCPKINTEGTVAVTKRAGLHYAEKGEVLRRLHEGELLLVLEEGKKWAKVRQLDGSEGWVNHKKAFK